MRKGSPDHGPAWWGATEYRESYQVYVGSAIYQVSVISICIAAA